jgi:hypothetical protein
MSSLCGPLNPSQSLGTLFEAFLYYTKQWELWDGTGDGVCQQMLYIGEYVTSAKTSHYFGNLKMVVQKHMTNTNMDSAQFTLHKTDKFFKKNFDPTSCYMFMHHVFKSEPKYRLY